MVVGQKTPIGVVAPNPGIAPEVEGAPASVPGGNEGMDKTKMTGTPATVAVAPPSISPDLPGVPNYVEADPSKIVVVPPPDNKKDAPSASSDVEQESPADDIPVDAVRDFTSPDGRLHRPAVKDVVDLTSLATDGSAEESGSEDEDSSGKRHVTVINASDGNGGSGHDGSVADPYAVTDAMRAEATAGSYAEIKTLEDYLKSVKAPETEADRKKRERRERARRVISAVGDGLSAIGNLIFTTQYAPNMYNPQNSAAEKTLGSIERARKEREANLDAYMRYSLALGKAKGERAKTLRELEAEMEKRKQAAEKAKQAAETHAFEKSL